MVTTDRQKLSPGAALAECAGREDRPCEHCGKIASMLGKAKYCSDSCNQKAYYWRVKKAKEASG